MFWGEGVRWMFKEKGVIWGEILGGVGRVRDWWGEGMMKWLKGMKDEDG